MRLDQLSEADVAAAIGPLDGWSHECHAASLRLVNSGLLPGQARVARGTLPYIGSQHSWAVVGDCYEPEWVVDVTAWSYSDIYPRVYVARGGHSSHRPHGKGTVFTYGYPIVGDGPAVSLAVSPGAKGNAYLRELARANGRHRNGIDIEGWLRIATGPMEGWPAKQVIEAMLDTPALAGLVPIDIAGMLTDRNPGGLYLPEVAPDYEPETS